MDRYIAPTKFIQYQLWQDCNNNCLFCSERHPILANKIGTLNYIMDKLDDPEVNDYEEVGIIGGEIFDYQLDNLEVHEKFYELLDKLCNMHWKKIYIATNLIYNPEQHLDACLTYLRKLGVADKVLLCTSYDTKWRFNPIDKLKLWDNNMKWLQENYPDFHRHIEIILTGDFIDKVLSDEFNIAAFKEKYNTRVDYIEPASGMHYANKQELQQVCPNFFPTKAKFIQFLKQECIEKKNVDLRCLISYQIRASRIYHLDQGQYVCYKDRRQPGFRVQCLDRTRKYELGFIDSDESMEDICVEMCEVLPDD